MTAMRSLLTNGKAGLIDLNLNKKQRVLSANASLSTYRDFSIFELTARPKADQTLDQARELLLSQIEKIKHGDFDESLIRSIVANFKLGRLQSLDNNGARAFNLFGNFILDKNASWSSQVGLLDAM